MNYISPQPVVALETHIKSTLTDEDEVISTIRSAFPNALAIYAFGSRITGTANADSDLDLAVLVAGYADPLQLWDIANNLADKTACPVDLLDMRAASTVMQSQVISTGKTVWDIGLPAHLFEVFVLSEKLALDEAREPLLQTITREGHVYAR